jgi:membrane-bound lytic murein transglycosylase B
VDGKAMPRSGEATLFLPGGATGPAFLVTANYDVIKAYNSSDAYAMGVASLGDRLMGGPPIQGTWPKDEPTLDKDQRQELQKRLSGLGLYEGDTDGKLGSRTRDAVRNFQLGRGLTPDGYADLAVLRELRVAR